jgi:hypothetical protein
MKTAHAFSIALLLGLAAALGALAATHTVATGHAKTASSAPVAVSLASRTARLNRWQHQLHRALHRRPLKLPKLVHFAPVAAPAAPAPMFASRVVAPPQRTIYVHAKAPPAAAHAKGHEPEGDHSGEGGHDD